MSLLVAPDPAPAAVVAPAAAPVAAAAADPTPVVVAAVDPLFPEPVAAAPAVVDPVVADPVVDPAVTRLAELEAAEAARIADVPADAASYKLELAEPILDPNTQKAIGFNAEDPLAKGALAWAHENKIPQAVFSSLLGVFAKNEMASLATHNDAVAAETAKLGAAAEARLTAVSNALTQHAGADGAKAIMSGMASADGVVALEKIVKALAGPSLGTPPPSNPASKLTGLSGEAALSAILT